MVRQERNAEVERRREALVASLRQQSAKWTTEENYTEKLKEDVFIYSPSRSRPAARSTCRARRAAPCHGSRSCSA